MYQQLDQIENLYHYYCLTIPVRSCLVVVAASALGVLQADFSDDIVGSPPSTVVTLSRFLWHRVQNLL
ncbi:hypothetical protein BJX63DRAFT_313749 [Aspergillus granulosus]|uniref:Uncharacterized protein n=1 Tax=Aspergillus granulosus TaxID=176169 RepID=A0ABR4HYH7_9EURO